MKLTANEGRDIVWGCDEDWAEIKRELIDQNRWSIIYLGVFVHKPTGKHYEMSWSVGATEYQDEQPFENHDPEPYEVIETERLVTVWERVND